MVPDRIVGLLCLGAAAALATWGAPLTDDAPGARSVRRASSSQAAGATTTTTAADDGPEGAGTAEGAASTTTTSGSAAPTTSTTVPPPAAASGEPDDALSRRVLLAAQDLPPGFVVVRQPSGEAAGNDGPFERCLGPDAAALTASVRAKARSAEFGRSGTGTVSSSSAVFDGAENAARVMRTLSTPPARACFEDLINARLARNPNLPEDARGTLTPLDAGPFGDGATGFRFEVRLPAEDIEDDPSEEEITYLADFVFVRKGRVLALLEFGSLRRPFPAGDVKSIATHLADRI